MDVAAEDHPKIVAFPPLLWLIGAVVSVLVHYFVFRFGFCRNHSR